MRMARNVLSAALILAAAAACGSERDLGLPDAGEPEDAGVVIVPDAGGTVERDRDKDGVPDKNDDFPDDPAESKDTDGDGVGDNADAFPTDPAASVDSDRDGHPDSWNTGATPQKIAASTLAIDVFPNDASESADSDKDGVGDNKDCCPGVFNPGQADLDADKIGDDCDDDIDGDDLGNDVEQVMGTDPRAADTDLDGVNDGKDAFPLARAASVDTDGDGHPDEWNAGATQQQISMSGLTLDALPDDPSEFEDTDGDRVGDVADTDDDNDGVADELDAFPKLFVAWQDTDADGMPDYFNPQASADQISASGLHEDMDDDNDAVPDSYDAFPDDVAASADADHDGMPDQWNAGATASQIANSHLVVDDDDDNDNLTDVLEAAAGTNPLKADTDGDGKKDDVDVFPLAGSEWADNDRDGIGDNGDLDDDNDLVPDVQEKLSGTDPLKADTDGDGFDDKLDRFPLLAAEWADNDRDGIGDNADLDNDNDGLADLEEAALGTDRFKADTDGDGVFDKLDAFPLSAVAAIDTDLDGRPDAFLASASPQQIAASGLLEDFDDDNDGLSDAVEAIRGTNPLLADTDGDGVTDGIDAFPLSKVAAVDSDHDGFPDAFLAGVTAEEIAASGLRVDAFPTDPAASLDSDGDGAPDGWNSTATPQQIATSTLVPDAFPANPAEKLDTDLDGIGNNADLDDDADGVPDIADAFPLDLTRFTVFNSPIPALRPPGTGAQSVPSAINDGGDVVGNAETATGSVVSAVSWAVDAAGVTTGAATGLGQLPGAPVGSFSAAHGVNNTGIIVGEAVNGAGDFTAVVWDPVVGPDAIPLNPIAGAGSGAFGAAYALNNNGIIVGESENRNFEPHGTVWRINAAGVVTGPFDLSNFLNGIFGVAHSVNDAGIVVGQAAITGTADIHATMWKVSATGGTLAGPIDMGVLPGHAGSAAFSVSPSGQVVGESTDAAGVMHAVMWTVDNVSALVLSGPVDFGPGTSASAVNNSTRFVGWTGVVGEGAPSIWDTRSTPNTNWDSVKPPPATGQAYGMNAAGQVVGVAAGLGFVATPQ